MRSRPGRSATIQPLTVASLELSEPLRPIRSEGFEQVRALIRWRGQPLGWLRLHPSQGEVAVARIEHAVLHQLRWDLVRATLSDRGDPALPVSPPITVVVCTRNRADLLEHCLGSLTALRYQEFEIIVVDNAPSDDTTANAAARFGVRYVREPRPGLDWARNRGIAESRHPIIAFTDDDVRVDPNWLAGLAIGFRPESVMAVTGLVAPAELATEAQVLFERVYGGMGKGMRGRLFIRDQMRPSQLIGIHAVGVGANMAFRRTVFDRLGGFDTALDVGTPACGAGDLDMFHRVVAAGMPLWYEPRALVWHRHRREMGELRRQLYHDGRSFAVYLLKLWRTHTVPRRSVVRYAFWQWGRWLLGRTLAGLAGRHPLPLSLLWAGLRGALDGPRAYLATYRHDRTLRATRPIEVS
jgi:glycosyltransferase involved in cell wall biosynthesis